MTLAGGEKGKPTKATTTGERWIYTKRMPAYDAKARGTTQFPDKISLKDLPEIEYPEEEVYMPEGVEPDVEQAPVTEEIAQSAVQPEVVVETTEEAKVEETPELEVPTAEETVVEEPKSESKTPPAEEKAEEKPESEPVKDEEEK